MHARTEDILKRLDDKAVVWKASLPNKPNIYADAAAEIRLLAALVPAAESAK